MDKIDARSLSAESRLMLRKLGSAFAQTKTPVQELVKITSVHIRTAEILLARVRRKGEEALDGEKKCRRPVAACRKLTFAGPQDPDTLGQIIDALRELGAGGGSVPDRRRRSGYSTLHHLS